MKTRLWKRMAGLVVVLVLLGGLAVSVSAETAIHIGGNWQAFADLSLVQTLRHATLARHQPALRQDGSGSVSAGYAGGEMITKPILFTGRRLVLNYSTAAAGSIRVEIQDTNGVPIKGYALAQSPERYLDEVEGVMSWASGPDVGTLAGTPVRLRFVLKDADLYALRFANPDNLQYRVSYQANGATRGTAPAAQTKEHGVSLPLAMNGGLSSLSKTGYAFAGWNTAADGSGTDYAAGASYTTDAAITLYARWRVSP